MKKISIVLTAASTFLATHVLAELSLVPVANDVTGSYIGVNIGLQNGPNNFKQKLNNADRKITNLTHDKKSNVAGGITLGYGRAVSRVYLGGEISANYISPDEKSQFHTQDGYLVKMKSKASYVGNLDFTPGVVLMRRLLLLGRVGLGYSGYHLNAVFRPGELEESNPVSKTKSFMALRYGLGLKLALTRDVNMGLDYIHIAPTKSLSFNSPNDYKYIIKPDRNQFDLSINYILDHTARSSDVPSIIND